jgi:hypothetical protein
MDLAYAVEAEHACGRSRRTTRKIARRLGSDEQAPHVPPPRPNRMHHATYERLCEAFLAREMARDAMLYAFALRHFLGIGNAGSLGNLERLALGK